MLKEKGVNLLLNIEEKKEYLLKNVDGERNADIS